LTVFAEEVVQAREARVRALETVLRSTVGFVLGFIAIVMILQAAGVNVVPLLTTASVAGLAIGFGAQTLVRDVISGFFILMEDQYGVGDYVTIGAVTGVVQELGMRTTRIRDNAGRLYIISNGSVGQVCNHSRGAYRAAFDISVPVESDLEMARAVLNEAGKELAERMPDLIRGPLACDGFIQVTGATATIRMTASIAPERQEDVHMALLDAARRAFAENNLKLA
jgi:small conductance mechanosensitive channel